MSKTVRKQDRFQYFEEDCACEYCKFNKRKGRGKKQGCGRAVCRYEKIRADAIAHGRVKREPGWNKWDG